MCAATVGGNVGQMRGSLSDGGVRILTHVNGDGMEVWAVLDVAQALNVRPAVTVLAAGLAALVLLPITRRC